MKNKLDKGFDKTAYHQLTKMVTVQLLVFNRLRTGEIEQMTVQNFKDRQEVDKKSELYSSLTLGEKIFRRNIF